MKKLVLATLFIPALAFAGVGSISRNISTNGGTTYDVWCTNGSHGYVLANGEYHTSWTGNGNDGQDFSGGVSVNEAARKICR